MGNFRPRPEVTSRANFAPGRNSTERTDSLRLLSNISHVVTKDISPKMYVEELKRAKFTVSPPGIGWDCHRTWEAVLFGSIPIVIQSPAYRQLYRDSPVMAVDDWTEVSRE